MQDPNKTICVVKHEGKEVDRIPASADNASDYITELAKHYGDVQVDYEHNEDAGVFGHAILPTKTLELIWHVAKHSVYLKGKAMVPIGDET